MRLEHWFYTIPLRLRSLFRRSQVEKELEEELQLHLAQRIKEGIGKGKTPDEARYAALRAMDWIEQRKRSAAMRAGCAGLRTWCKMQLTLSAP